MHKATKERDEFFVKSIRKIFKDSELTQVEFAKKIKASQSLVSKWLNGKMYPKEEHLRDICRLFDISLENIVLQDDEIKLKKRAKSVQILLLNAGDDESICIDLHIITQTFNLVEFNTNELFAIKINNSSLFNIPIGSTIVGIRTSAIVFGGIYVAQTTNGEYITRRAECIDDKIFLMADSMQFKPISSDYEIVGKAIGVISAI